MVLLDARRMSVAQELGSALEQRVYRGEGLHTVQVTLCEELHLEGYVRLIQVEHDPQHRSTTQQPLRLLQGACQGWRGGGEGGMKGQSGHVSAVLSRVRNH